ncbi:MAG TPA: hypothetical protein VFO65_01185 [Acidimicrobiales bacterium]|nr:hypothetical protein [Acidimicrobiales bacterium]
MTSVDQVLAPPPRLLTGAHGLARDGVPSRAAVRPSRDRWLDRLFLVGLAGVFLVNGVVALVQPEDFTALVARSPLGRGLGLADLPVLAPLIALNDLALGLAVLAAIRLTRMRTAILAWTGTWLFAITVIKLTALGG